LGGASNAVVLNQEVYNVVISASTLVWAISTAFLFINLVKFYLSDRREFRKHLIFPMPVLWISIVSGTTTCVISIIGALVFSLIPQLIDNNIWWLIVGGITLVGLVLAAVGGMLASSEADWQKLHE
jgi:glutamate:GABA antiporter